MMRRAWPLIALTVTACVTVNIYFPAAAVRQAADEIVEETWGGKPGAAAPSGQTQLGRTNMFAGFAALSSFLGLVSEARAQEADINISNPAIRSIKDRMRQRSGQLKPFLDSKNVGIDKNGYLELLNADGIGLKDRSTVNQLVSAENQDRKTLYTELAKANNLEGVQGRIQQIFADTWRDKAQKGWQIQQNDGKWVTK